MIASVLALAGCADKPGGPIPYNVSLAPPDQPRAVSLEENYRIAPLDTVTVNVFRQKDLSGDYEVDLTGRISMPLIGTVEAVDLTAAQLEPVEHDVVRLRAGEHLRPEIPNRVVKRVEQ